MSSVTARIREIKQPRGGYLNISNFKVYQFKGTWKLDSTEDFPPAITGMVVENLTKVVFGSKIIDAFESSIKGAIMAEKYGYSTAGPEIAEYLSNIYGYSRNSIINACKAVTFDVWYKNGKEIAEKSMSAKDISPFDIPIHNIQSMINRSISFFSKQGSMIDMGFCFDEEGYTSTVDTGNADFLTSDTLWEFKVSSAEPTSAYTLQLLMYYIMAVHSKREEFKRITKIGIFNPRLYKAYIMEVKDISPEIIKEVEQKVICY